jgi:hypothetical protein
LARKARYPLFNPEHPSMPSKSPKQARLMAAAAHNPQFAKKAGIPQEVAQEYNQADKGGKLLSRAMKGKGKGK